MLLLQKNSILNGYRKQRRSEVQSESYQKTENKTGQNAAASHKDPNALLDGLSSDKNADLDAFYSVGHNSPYTGTITRVLPKKLSQYSQASIVSEIKNTTNITPHALVSETDIEKCPSVEIHSTPTPSNYEEGHSVSTKDRIHDIKLNLPAEGNVSLDQDCDSPLVSLFSIEKSTAQRSPHNGISFYAEKNAARSTPDGVSRVLMNPSVEGLKTPIHKNHVELHQKHKGTELESQSNTEGETPFHDVNDTPLAESRSCNENNTFLTFKVSATSSFDEDISALSFPKQPYQYSLITGSGGDSYDGNINEDKYPLGLLVSSKRHSVMESTIMEPLGLSRAESSAFSLSCSDMLPLSPSSLEFRRYYGLGRKKCGGRSVLVTSSAAMTMVNNRHTPFRSSKSMELFSSRKSGVPADTPIRIVRFHRESVSSGNMDYDVDTIVVSPFNTSDISSRYIGSESQNRILDFQNERYLYTLKSRPMISAISFGEAVNLLKASVKVVPKLLEHKKMTTFFSCFCFDKSGNDNVLDHKAMKNNKVDLKPYPISKTASWKEGLKVVERLKSTPYDHNDVVHQRIIFTIYYALMDSEKSQLYNQIMSIRKFSLVEQAAGDDPLTFPRDDSALWEVIGFQGTNPSSDLRDTGMVGLLQLLYMFSSYAGLTLTLWHLCQSPSLPSPSESLFSLASTPAIPTGSRMLSRDLPFVLVVLTFVGLSLDFLGKEKRLMSLAISFPVQGKGIEGVSPVVKSASKSSGKHPNLEESPVFHVSPVLSAVCEHCVGCLQLFCESWQELIKKQYPNIPTVADFGSQKSRLQDRLMKRGGTDLVKEAIKRAKQYA
ncbi:unnamed protein product [Phytomonas sp. Hart1]|nr:unnamed protein product [Phytomonas sp. Hart1]|eukprot:CCW67003.1 unnamed protein product [Phytomonas sp. isolate Hart1]